VKKLSITIIISLITIGYQALSGQDIKVSASVDRNPVGVDEQFVYQVEISGSLQNLPNVELPDFYEFAIVGGPSSSSSFQIINFKVSSSKTYTVYLMPRKVGAFTINPASAEYKGQKIQSDAVDITVVKSTTQKQPSQSAPSKPALPPAVETGDAVFLKVFPSGKTAYINEEIVLSYKIYFKTNITGNEVTKLPEAVGSWVESYPTAQRPRIYTETIKGIPYNVAEIRKVAVFPSKAGKLTISPMEMIVDVVVRRQRRRDPFSIFDDFFNDPFGQVVKKRISSGAVNINVKPLPDQDRPPQFTGLVGDFKVQSSLDKESIPANEAVSYKIKIFGTGLLKFLNTVPQEFSPDFEVFDPKVKESINKKGDKISSVKEFEYVLIPRVPGNQKIKSFQLSYFNPSDKKYKSLTVPEYNLEVTKGKDLAVGVGSGTVLSKEEVQLIGQDIRFIKEKIAGLRPIGHMPYKNWWFYLSITLPILLLGIAWIYRNHLEKMSSNIQYARSRRAHKQAHHHLKQAKSFLKSEKKANFYSAISNSLLGYVADKTNRPTAGILREEVQDLLKSIDVEKSLQKDYFQCLDEADFRRFAPGNANQQQMQEFYHKTEKVLVGLEKYF
jgi:hypothetical protein